MSLNDRAFQKVMLDLHDGTKRFPEVWTARARLIGWSGPPLRSPNPNGTRPSGTSDPTGTAALAWADRAGKARHDLEQAAIKARDAMFNLVAIAATYLDDTVHDEQIAAWNTRCTVCDAQTNQIVPSVPGQQDAEGAPVRLCEAHLTFRARYQCDPTRQVTEWLLRFPASMEGRGGGQRGFVRLMLEQMPDVYARTHMDTLASTGVLGATGTWKDRTA